MPVQIIPHHTSMQNYLVIAHHTDNNENLDWIVSTTDGAARRRTVARKSDREGRV